MMKYTHSSFLFYFPLDEPFVVDLISILTVHLVTSVEKKKRREKVLGNIRGGVLRRLRITIYNRKCMYTISIIHLISNSINLLCVASCHTI